MSSGSTTRRSFSILDHPGGGGGAPGTPLLTLAPSQPTNAAIGRYATAAELVPVYDAYITAGVTPDIRVDGSASGGAIAWDTSITLDPTTVISGRNVVSAGDPIDTITVADGVIFFPGTIEFAKLVGNSSSAMGTVTTGSRELILRNNAKLQNTGSTPMFQSTVAAAILDIRGYDTSEIRAGADDVAASMVAGAILNIHATDKFTVASNSVSGRNATAQLNALLYSPGVSVSDTQGASTVAVAKTLYSVATQISATLPGGGTSTVAQTLAGLPRLIWQLDPTISVASQLETTQDGPGATVLSFVANPAEPTNDTVLSIAMNAVAGPIVLRIKDPTTGLLTLPLHFMFTCLLGYRNAANNNQIGPMFLYGDTTHYVMNRLATAFGGAGILHTTVNNNGTYQNRASSITTLANRSVGSFWWARQTCRVWMKPSTGAAIPEFLAEMGGPDASGLGSVTVTWDRVTNLGAGWSAFNVAPGGAAGDGWGIANGCRTGGFAGYNDSANATTLYVADARFYELP